MITTFYGKMKDLLGGTITLEGLAKAFDATKHPQVASGEKHEEEVFTEFTKGWGNLDPFVPIMLETWMSYYCDISSCVVRDDHFEKLILSPFNVVNS